jgi:hypothetical protein
MVAKESRELCCERRSLLTDDVDVLKSRWSADDGREVWRRGSR